MERTRPTTRRRVSALVAAALVLTLTGCTSEPMTGAAFPDLPAADALAAQRFDAQLVLLEQRINETTPFFTDAETDITGVDFMHAKHGDRESSGQSVVAVRGNPVSVLVKETDIQEGYTLDTLHIGGESMDYLLLGDSYSSLAPTKWVAVPTLYGAPQDSIFATALHTMCFITGFQTMCEIVRTIQTTAESDLGAQRRRSAQTDEDGSVHSQTEVTLAAVVAEDALLNIPTEVSDLFTPEMLASFIPVNIWQNPDGTLIKMEMAGTVPGTDGVADFVVQVGFEITGKTTDDTFPTTPSPWDVTVLDDSAAAALYAALGEQ